MPEGLLNQGGQLENRIWMGSEMKFRFDPKNYRGVIGRPVKSEAYKAVRSAMKKGVLIQQPCRVCGDEDTQAHSCRLS